jgi:hypothetical protein
VRHLEAAGEQGDANPGRPRGDSGELGDATPVDVGKAGRRGRRDLALEGAPTPAVLHADGVELDARDVVGDEVHRELGWAGGAAREAEDEEGGHPSAVP